MFAGDADADGWTAALLSNHVCTNTVTVGAQSTTHWQDGLRLQVTPSDAALVARDPQWNRT